jgi:hypothetical protein
MAFTVIIVLVFLTRFCSAYLECIEKISKHREMATAVLKGGQTSSPVGAAIKKNLCLILSGKSQLV